MPLLPNHEINPHWISHAAKSSPMQLLYMSYATNEAKRVMVVKNSKNHCVKSNHDRCAHKSHQWLLLLSSWVEMQIKEFTFPKFFKEKNPQKTKSFALKSMSAILKRKQNLPNSLNRISQPKQKLNTTNFISIVYNIYLLN